MLQLTRGPRIIAAALALTTLAATVVATGIAPAGAPAAAATSASSAVPGPIVLIGTGGIRWDDADESTPALFSTLGFNSIGALAVRSVRSTTCPVDGWLAVSAGRRAADTPRPSGAACLRPEADLPTPGGPATVPRWSVYRHQAAKDPYGATLGLLGQALAKGSAVTAAVGPGAVIALADANGRVDRAWPGMPSGTTSDPGRHADATQLGNDVRDAVADTAAAAGTSRRRVIVVDAGAITTGQITGTRSEQAADIDTRIGLVLGALPADATVLIASLADSNQQTPHLQLLAASGPVPGGGRYTAGLLGSRSTRQLGLAQSTDLTPTLLAAAGLPVPDQAVGSPILPVRHGEAATTRLAQVISLDDAAQSVHSIMPWFFDALVLAQIVLYGIATLALRRERSGPMSRRRALRWLRRMAVTFAAVPAATFLANLVPWWKAGIPWLTVLGLVAAFTLPIALLALLGPWRRTLLGPMGVVGGITASVLAIDVITGSHLVLSSLMGVQPLVAGRFYGLSNVGFALFATGALLATLAITDVLVPERLPLALAVVAGVGLAATVIDGAPGLGSDFGGPPAIIPAFAVLGLLIAGYRLTWRRIAIIAAGTLAVVVVLSVLDWLRPAADRTHLGRFVQTVIDGGAWPVLERKATQNVRILFTSWLSALLPIAIAFVALVLARPVAWGVRPLQLAYDRSRVLRHGMVAFGVLCGVALVLNDSGTVIPAVAATLAIPLLIAVSVRAVELDDLEQLEAAVERARRASPRRR